MACFNLKVLKQITTRVTCYLVWMGRAVLHFIKQTSNVILEKNINQSILLKVKCHSLNDTISNKGQDLER